MKIYLYITKSCQGEFLVFFDVGLFAGKPIGGRLRISALQHQAGLLTFQPFQRKLILLKYLYLLG